MRSTRRLDNTGQLPLPRSTTTFDLFTFNLVFYPRDAMLVQLLAMALCLCLSVCLSVTSRCSVEAVGRIELVFGMRASFDLTYTVF